MYSLNDNPTSRFLNVIFIAIVANVKRYRVLSDYLENSQRKCEWNSSILCLLKHLYLLFVIYVPFVMFIFRDTNEIYQRKGTKVYVGRRNRLLYQNITLLSIDRYICHGT